MANMALTRSELLARCLPILEAVTDGKPVEDSFVELKAELPKKAEGARGLAGSANAAGGEPVIWLVGVDEKSHKIVGAAKEELSEWFPRLKRCFDGPAPTLSMVENIPIGGQIVVAMVFETGETPYVVSMGSDLRDIPWREGTRTRSAYRQEVLRTLDEPTLLPVVEVTSAAVRPDLNSTGQVSQIVLYAYIYIKPRSDRTLVFPRHDCNAYLEVPGSLPKMPFDRIWLFPAEDRHKSGDVPADVSVDRPKALYLIAFIGPIVSMNGQKAKIEVSLLPVNFNHPVVVRHELTLPVTPEVVKPPQRTAESIDLWKPRPL
jgi:hypothetical protein